MIQTTNCPIKPVTEKSIEIISKGDFLTGCLIIVVTENKTKLWSITITGRTILDQKSKDAVFYQLAEAYNWAINKTEKMKLLVEYEKVILPRLGIKPMHRKSLIRKLRKAIISPEKKVKRGRKPKYNDFDKFHLKQIWKLSGYPYILREAGDPTGSETFTVKSIDADRIIVTLKGVEITMYKVDSTESILNNFGMNVSSEDVNCDQIPSE